MRGVDFTDGSQKSGFRMSGRWLEVFTLGDYEAKWKEGKKKAL